MKKIKEILPFNYENLDAKKTFIVNIENREIVIEVTEVEFSKKIGYILWAKHLRMIKKAEKFAKTDANILIEGENGTGKEILAQGIHMSSFRKNNIFVPINMTTISPNLLEELYL